MIDFKAVLYEAGRNNALKLQAEAAELDGTAMYAREDDIPTFRAALAKMNMLERPIGFVCKSSAGRVVRLVQPYDSEIYTEEPEKLDAQWGFVWSKDPGKALPFLSLATSPYNAGDCCVWEGNMYRSIMDGNVFSPGEYPEGWEAVL